MLDIDYFKCVNDNYGHSSGDIVIKEFASRIENELRSYDIFSRVGGEEFAILLPETDKSHALDIAERCRTAIADHPFKIETTNISVTTSIGVCFDNSNVNSVEQMMKQADKNLYAAKVSGRNKVFNQ